MTIPVTRRQALAGAAAVPAAAGRADAGPRWVFFVAWTGDRNGTTVSGMSEIASPAGPVRQWSDVQGLVDGVLAGNPGVVNVRIGNYQLLRIE